MIAEVLLDVTSLPGAKLIDAADQSYGWRVRFLCEQREWSRPQLASAIADILGSMTATSIGNIEADRQRPYPRTQAAIAQVFGVPESWLITGRVPSDAEMAEAIIRNGLFLRNRRNADHLYETWQLLFEREKDDRRVAETDAPYSDGDSELTDILPPAAAPHKLQPVDPWPEVDEEQAPDEGAGDSR